MRAAVHVKCLLPAALALSAAAAAQPAVTESARRVPVAYRVDVVVVGGSSGAVAAAAAAAGRGASVFLAAPRHYLGDDLCGPLRLWLEPGEMPTTPLAKAMFGPAGRAGGLIAPDGALRFTYEADRPSAGRHKDTRPPSVLTDGLCGRPHTDSVQYDGDVNVTADLGGARQVERAHVMLYHTRDFRVDGVTVFVSNDKAKWEQVAEVKNSHAVQPADPDAPVVLSAVLARTARYVRLHVRKARGAARVLVGEIVLQSAVAPASGPRPAVCHRGTPLRIKRALDRVLLEAGVKFLFGCLASDVVRNAAGQPCGIVMANRAGRQAVLAKVIIDATGRATVARLAGAKFRPYPPGRHAFRYVVIGGGKPAADLTARLIGPPLAIRRRRPGRNGRPAVPVGLRIIEYTLRVPMPDSTFPAFAGAEQLVRDRVADPAPVLAAEVPFQVPPDPVEGRQVGPDKARPASGLEIDAFRPAGVGRLFLLSGCADIPRAAAEKLLRPLALMAMGERIGAAAADEAKALPAPAGASLPGREVRSAAAGDTREVLTGVRPIQKLPTIPQARRGAAVLGRYDVVVVGGGTSGAPAGIAAARRGAKTLVVEYQYGLGGVSTLGAIGRYYHGYRGGFTREIDAGVGRRGSVQARMEWFRAALRKAGADIWFGCLGCGAFVTDGRVVGVVVATPAGRGVVLAKVVIDATGNADVAAAAGAPCRTTGAADIAVQGAGLPPLSLGASYVNTDFTLCDETDVVDTSHLFVYTRARFGRAFDQGQLIDTRERRRIVGEFTMTILDQVLGRKYGDTISQAASNFDSHGYTTDPFFVLSHPRPTRPHTPYRCLLPKGLEGILVVGLGFSAHRDAIPMTRMQPDLQNHGYAAGVAAAMAAKLGGATRRIDVRELQKHLVEKGCLPASVLADKDSLPLSDERIAQAVGDLAARPGGGTDRDVAAILAHPARSGPLLRAAYASAEDDRVRLRCAHVLAVIGDASAVDAVVAAVAKAPEWDKGWNYRAMGQFGSSMSGLDKLIYALGRAGDRRAVPVILDKVKRLGAAKAFSHHRAVALALEMLGDPAAAEPLAALLAKAGMTGHAIQSVQAALERMRVGTDVSTRRHAIRELLLARALYRCGDRDRLGERILTAYTRDLRGHLARHAHAVLQAGPGPVRPREAGR